MGTRTVNSKIVYNFRNHITEQHILNIQKKIVFLIKTTNNTKNKTSTTTTKRTKQQHHHHYQQQQQRTKQHQHHQQQRNISRYFTHPLNLHFTSTDPNI